MSRAKLVTNSDGKQYGIRIDCPGCALIRERGSKMVVLPVTWIAPGHVQAQDVNQAPHWGFNGDFERPTFTPSILSRWEEWQGEGVPPKQHICHSFVTDGRIQFLADCTHALAGQTVDLPELEA